MFFRLLYRLVAQKPLQFFKDHASWIKTPDEKFAPKNGTIGKNDTKPLKDPVKRKDEGTEMQSLNVKNESVSFYLEFSLMSIAQTL